MIDWSRGYSCEFSIVQIDPKTWTKMNPAVSKLQSVSISRDGTDEVPLLETASLTVDGLVEDGWYRVMMKAMQEDSYSNEPLGTFYLTTSSASYYGTTRRTSSVSGVSVLSPCSKIKCRLGDYAPKGGNLGAWVVGMLKKGTPAPIRLLTDDRVGMSDYFVFDSGTKVIESVWNVLDIAEWCLQIDGTGVIWVMPKPKEAKVVMDRSAYGILQPQFDNNPDREDAPNVFRITDTEREKEIEIINADPKSAISTVNRGFRVEETETDPSTLEGETYENYGKRKLKELTIGMNKWDYTREYIPDLRVFDIWDCRRTDVGLVGNGRILSQSLHCEKGVTVSEKIGLEVDDYVVEYVDLTDN